MLDWDAESAEVVQTKKEASEEESEEVGGCADNPPPPTAADRDLRTSGGSRPCQAPRPRGHNERPPLKRRRRHTCDQGPQEARSVWAKRDADGPHPRLVVESGNALPKAQPKARPRATIQATAATAIGARQKTAIGARQKVVLRPNAALRFAQSRGGACPRLNANTAIGSRAPKLLHEKPLPKASQPRGSIAVTASGASPRPVAKPRPKAAQSRGTIAVTESERARPRGTMEVINV